MKTLFCRVLNRSCYFLAILVPAQSLHAASPALITTPHTISTTAAGDSVNPVFSGNDRYILFSSLANNITPNQVGDSPFVNVFRHDLVTQQTILISVDTSGNSSANANAVVPGISADGTRIAFSSIADNIVPGATNQLEDVFVRDLTLGTTTRISVRPPNIDSEGASRRPIISDNGEWVVYESTSSTITDGISNRTANLFAHNLETGATHLLTGQAQPNPNPASTLLESGSMDANGTRVAFLSSANNITADPPEGQAGIYIYSLTEHTTYKASTNFSLWTDPTPPPAPILSLNGEGLLFRQYTNLVHHDLRTGQNRIITDRLEVGSTTSISADGESVAYESVGQVYAWNAQSNTSTLVSSNHQNSSAADARTHSASISRGGNTIAFLSAATDLVPGITNGISQVYLRDLTLGMTSHVSRDNNGTAATDPIDTTAPALNSNGSCVAFETSAHLTPGDHNRARDIFLHHLASQHTRPISAAGPGVHQAAGISTPRPNHQFLSADARWLVFESYDGEHFPGDKNGFSDVFLRDLESGRTLHLSTNSAGYFSPTNAGVVPVLSGSGNKVAFLDIAHHPGGLDRPYVRVALIDLTTGTRVTVPFQEGFINPDESGPPILLNHQGNRCYFESARGIYSFNTLTSELSVVHDDSSTPQLSRNGQWLTHYRNQDDLLLTDLINETTIELDREARNQKDAAFSPDNQFLAFSAQGWPITLRFVFLRNLTSETTDLVWENGINPALSADARIIAIEGLQPDPLDENHQLIVINTVKNSTNIVATNQTDDEPIRPIVTDDGRHVVFVSDSESVVSTPTHGIHQLYVYDTLTGTTLLASINKDGTAGGNRRSTHPTLGADGQTVLFRSLASDLVPNDYSDRGNLYLLSLGGNDTDEDTLDDDWEVAFFSNLDQGPNDDFDNDNSTNKSEHDAGTDPTNGNFVFRVITLTRSGSDTTLLWSAVPGKTYTAQYKATADATAWVDIPGDVTPEGSTGSKVDTTGSSARFYRVVLK